MAPSKKFDPKRDLVDLKGKVIIVTGANRPTGLGYGTVRHLARAGAKVYIAARNEAQSLQSIEKLKQDGLEPGNGEVVFLKLDLSDPREAKKAAEEFLSKEKRLDVLVNNAAMVFAPYEVNKDGISTQVTTNYISPFIFTQTLLPLMSATAGEPNSDVRIVNMSSATHMVVPALGHLRKREDLNAEFKGKLLPKFRRYGHTKLLGILWTRALQKHLDTSDPPVPITAMAVSPGGVDTFTYKYPLAKVWGPLLRIVLTTSDLEIGTYPSAFAAAGKAVKENKEKYKGAYVVEKPVGAVGKPSADARNDELADELWVLTVKLLNDMDI